jgi:signal transduction histidine kinase
LGLPITRQLVELQHGKVWLESEVGRGSTFTIALPALPENV